MAYLVCLPHLRLAKPCPAATLLTQTPLRKSMGNILGVAADHSLPVSNYIAGGHGQPIPHAAPPTHLLCN